MFSWRKTKYISERKKNLIYNGQLIFVWVSQQVKCLTFMYALILMRIGTFAKCYFFPAFLSAYLSDFYTFCNQAYIYTDMLKRTVLENTFYTSVFFLLLLFFFFCLFFFENNNFPTADMRDISYILLFEWQKVVFLLRHLSLIVS